MALSTNFFYDGADLASSTKIFLDKLGLIPAPNGFYKENGIVREYLNGAFVSTDDCDCPNDCDYIAELTDDVSAIYNATFNVGSATGAIVLRATPSNKNFGMAAIYDSVNYKNVYVGFSMLTTPRDFVIWGQSQTSISGCPNQFADSLYTNVDNYVMSGNVFSKVSIIPSITAYANQVFNTALVLGMIIIPKTSAVINSVSVSWYGLCPNFDATIEGNCVESLFEFFIFSDAYISEAEACDGVVTSPTAFYCVKKNLSEPNITSGDVAFVDPNAVTPMPAGYYIYDASGPKNIIIQIGNDGIILSITECK
jgi:hypothetical protein